MRTISKLGLLLILAAGTALLFLDRATGTLKILLPVAFVLAVLVALPGKRKPRADLDDRKEGDLLEEPEPAEEPEKAAELMEAHQRAAEWKEKTAAMAEKVLAFEAAIPVVKKLSELVTRKSERSTIDLTQDIFSIAEVSNDVSKKIHTLLEEMTRGERSVEHNVARLETEVETLSAMEDAFLGILKGYREEIVGLSKAIGDIKNFTEALTDLSERTHILAINASVEAARVGAKGAGFAVIAGEVQKLAAHSKEIAASIRDLTGRIDRQVHSSFKEQGEQIDQAVQGIQASKGDLGTIVHVFAPQAKMLSESIGESKRLSENVTENLNSITVSLQFQDYIRQVIEHIIAVLEEQKKSFLENFPADSVEPREKYTILEEEMKRKASKYFTIRDEWEIVGLMFDETREKKSSDGSVGKDFNGDVLLF